ncbi:hypothetical protein POM88_049312 [Heracleum sosnowskyi]|uniref:non-specific serine/threonine protein kinase n=1 Tax=Heracleum sosnowskyi TaxID=360622 RepID=A0AAD8M0F8_9APIA|nr:hypothetical protein POM88_049312 [Heracleum sosnowskyi]
MHCYLLLYPAGTSENAPPRDYSLAKSSSSKLFNAFTSISRIAAIFGNGILPEIQVSRHTVRGFVEEDCAKVVEYFDSAVKLALKIKSEDLELPLVDFDTVAKATNYFSLHNKLREGGFGPVYKGLLGDGKGIAVKRLSKNSRQGIKEFKNKVVCIAKLQHRNLLKLVGCCIQEEEKMLIYEYLPNRGLDFFIFDVTKPSLSPSGLQTTSYSQRSENGNMAKTEVAALGDLL